MGRRRHTIPQVELPEDAPDEVKAQIAPINRLHSTPTAAEADFFKALLNDDWEARAEAAKRIEEERGE